MDIYGSYMEYFSDNMRKGIFFKNYIIIRKYHFRIQEKGWVLSIQNLGEWGVLKRKIEFSIGVRGRGLRAIISSKLTGRAENYL